MWLSKQMGVECTVNCLCTLLLTKIWAHLHDILKLLIHSSLHPFLLEDYSLIGN